MLFETLTFDDVLIVPKYSDINSRDECVPEFMSDISNPLSLRIPIIASNMDTICGFKMHNKMQDLGGLGILHRYMSSKDLANIAFPSHKTTIAISVGSINSEDEKDKLKIATKWDNVNLIICVDIAHGHSKHMKDTLDYIRNILGFAGLVIAGNVCTPKAVEDLNTWGADIVKVGVGAGSVCSTRIQTGCGYPQLQAILDCSKVVSNITEEYIPIIADGGIKTPGDVCKAIACGASYVMIGGMLAGTDCTPNWVPPHRAKYSEYRGMASDRAKIAAGKDPAYIEGIALSVQNQEEGSTERIINSIEEGLKSAMSYVGARNLDEFKANAEIIRVSSHVKVENHPHF